MVEYESARYYVWLQTVLGGGSLQSDRVLARFPDPRWIYENIPEVVASGLLTEAAASRMKNADLSKVDKIFRDCQVLGLQIITLEDPRYPFPLRGIPCAPYVLYLEGELPGLSKELAVSVVGTRQISQYGFEAAFAISRDLASQGVWIISGLARGADTAAHLGALAGRGRTVAVLAGGLDLTYPAENAALRKQIVATGGGVLSEYPPGVPCRAGHFPERNRIVTGIGRGLFVVEAPAKSGSLISAEWALSQGKDIFVLPNDIFDPNNDGVARLLRDGALPITSAQDILQEWSFLPLLSATRRPTLSAAEQEQIIEPFMKNVRKYKLKLTEQEAAKKSFPQQVPITPEAAPSVPKKPSRSAPLPAWPDDPVCLLLRDALADAPRSADELMSDLGLDAGTLFSKLTELELGGFICQGRDFRYSPTAQ